MCVGNKNFGSALTSTAGLRNCKVLLRLAFLNMAVRGDIEAVDAAAAAAAVVVVVAAVEVFAAAVAAAAEAIIFVVVVVAADAVVAVEVV